MAHSTKALEPRLVEINGSPGAAALHDPSLRLPALLDTPHALGASLGQLELLLVGAGSVGMPIALWAAQVGVKRLVIVDRARVKPQSLSTHPVGPEDVGEPKALVAARRAKALSPRTRVDAFVGDVAELPVHAMAGVHYILTATDNVLAETQVAQRALHLGLPLLQGSVYGRTLTAQVRAVSGGPEGDGPCLACAYGPHELAQLDTAAAFSCSGETPDAATPLAAPTLSPPFLCQAAASLTFVELTRRAVGLVGVEQNLLIEYGGYDHATRVTPLERRADCILNHECLHPRPPDAQLGARTPNALLEAAGMGGANLERVSLRVEGNRFAALAHCDCKVKPVLGRFVPDAAATPPVGGHCLRCHAPLVPHPFYVHSEVPLHLLAGRLDRSLADLGVPHPSSAQLRCGDRSALFIGASSEVS